MERAATTEPINVRKAATGLRILKFQATSLGFTLLLVLPIFGLLAFVSSFEITSWSAASSNAPPIVDEENFFTAVFTLMMLGYVASVVSAHGGDDPSMVVNAGPKMALRVYLPWMAVSLSSVLIVFLGVPAWAGFDVHFNHLDMVGFVVAAVVSIVGVIVLNFKLSPSIQPEAHELVRERKALQGVVGPTEERQSAAIVFLIFCLSIVSVIVACECCVPKPHPRKSCETHDTTNTS